MLIFILSGYLEYCQSYGTFSTPTHLWLCPWLQVACVSLKSDQHAQTGCPYDEHNIFVHLQPLYAMNDIA